MPHDNLPDQIHALDLKIERLLAHSENSEIAMLKIEKLIESHGGRLRKLEHWRTALATGGAVALVLLKDRAFTLLGINLKS